jgi:hypothetical protein
VSSEETRRVLTALQKTFSDLADRACSWKGEYGQGLETAYERCADEVDEILKEDL